MTEKKQPSRPAPAPPAPKRNLGQGSRAAYVLSRVAILNATVAGLVADNAAAEARSEPPPWTRFHFDRAVHESGLENSATVLNWMEHGL